MMKSPVKEMTVEQRIAAWIEHIPEKYRGTYRKAMTGHSRQKAIHAKCQDCMNWQVAEIRRCDIVTCPLYPYRPSSARTNPSEDSQNEKTALVGCQAT
jgi:hypothetical protein